jgi:hypothetical protein
MTVVPTGYLKSHPAMKQEAQLQKLGSPRKRMTKTRRDFKSTPPHHAKIRQLGEIVKPLVPEDSQYNERYWMAAYILYPKGSELLEKLKRFKETYFEMKKFEKVVESQKEEKEKLKARIKLLERDREHIGQDIEESLSENLNYYLSFNGSELEDMIWRITTEYYDEYYKKGAGK